MNIERFPPEVIRHLGCYVYRLIDPRNGETFYAGKGKGNRLFEHVAAAFTPGTPNEEEKLGRIREIIRAGLEVGHIVQCHGMDEKTALEVEAALLDASPGLIRT
jgi:hypothetical protein